MKLLFSYLRRQLGAIGVVCVLFVFLAAATLLYGLPPAAIGYGAVLCLFTGGVFLAAGYIRFLRRHRALAELHAPGALWQAAMPLPQSTLEADYQAVIEALRREGAQEKLSGDRRFRDMMEYYTLWAHQIKTPIAAMELVLARSDGPETAELREQLFRVGQYAEMVLGYLRLDGDTTDFVIARYDLDSIVRQAVRKYASQFIRRRIKLCYEPLETEVLTDEKWLLFAVEQVLSNALKYTAEGSVTISMEPGKTLVIRDTGIGIRAEDLPRVFDRGFTGANGRADKRATGIGLYLTRRICEKLGHTIAIDSAPGRGTAVRLGLMETAVEAE